MKLQNNIHSMKNQYYEISYIEGKCFENVGIYIFCSTYKVKLFFQSTFTKLSLVSSREESRR